MIRINPSNQFFSMKFGSCDLGDFFVNADMENPAMFVKVSNDDAIDLITRDWETFKWNDTVFPVNVEINFEYMMAYPGGLSAD